MERKLPKSFNVFTPEIILFFREVNVKHVKCKYLKSTVQTKHNVNFRLLKVLSIIKKANLL